jgi:hypothetical protein
MAVNIYDELAALSARVSKLEAATAPRLRVAPVTYFRSSALWQQALDARPAFVMINPGSGPGTQPDSLYVGLVPKAHLVGVPVLGYVHTKYGARPIAEVKADIDKHFLWYGVRGIFVDTCSNKPELVAYYAELSAHIKAKGGLVCLNPGTATIEAYAALADWIMVAETDALAYLTKARPEWESRYPGKMYHCVHSCSAADMPRVVAAAKSRGAGVIYCTDDVMANPYDTLPSYWTSFLAAVQP